MMSSKSSLQNMVFSISPYHTSNGQAERHVQNVKKFLREMIDRNSFRTQAETDAVTEYLFSYRRAPNVSTGESPAFLFLERQIRSKLDLICPQKSLDIPICREFSIEQVVLFRNYSGTLNG